jgi:hypothetical protein
MAAILGIGLVLLKLIDVAQQLIQQKAQTTWHLYVSVIIA